MWNCDICVRFSCRDDLILVCVIQMDVRQCTDLILVHVVQMEVKCTEFSCYICFNEMQFAKFVTQCTEFLTSNLLNSVCIFLSGFKCHF